MQLALHHNTKKIGLIAAFLFIAIGFLGLILWTANDFYINQAASLAVTNRSVNAYFGALITAMALIITLTSNLYSPMLSKVFVSHPYTIIGISYILLTNFVITMSQILTPEHPWFSFITFFSFSMTIVAMLGIIPFLFLISRFIKPSYFVPLLGEYSLKNIQYFHSKKRGKTLQEKEVSALFELIDVISNMSSTAIMRSDRRTLKVVIDELFNILNKLITNQNHTELDHSWRFNVEHFTTGLSDEGQYYLKKFKTWPEAYILSKILDNALAITEKDNEIIPYICRKLTNAIDISFEKKNYNLVELHLMILNSVLNNAIESRNQSKFSSVLYYYRLNTELLIDHDRLRNFAIENFIFYGEKALQYKELRATKDFLYDLGRIMHYLSFQNEKIAIEVYQTKIKKVWQKFEKHPDQKENCIKSIVKTFWILYSQNYNQLTNQMREDFLTDNLEHAQVIKTLLNISNPLNKEFNEVLVSPEYITGMAFTLANDFLNEFQELKGKD